MAVNNKAADLFNVNGIVAVITGGGTGLGLYAARALDANGAKAVYIVGRREDTLKSAAKTAVNGTIKPIVGDVNDKESLLKVAEQVRQEQGFINLLFANAGVNGPSHAAAPGKTRTVKEFQESMLKLEMDEFSFVQQVNNTGVFYTAVAFLDLLDAGNQKGNLSQDSQILVTSSVAGLSRHMMYSFAYATSKAAVNHLVKGMATFFAQQKYRIRVNGICPGFYPSEMTAGWTKGLEKLEEFKEHPGILRDAYKIPTELAPAERSGSEEDFAGVILFLASRAGAYGNGQILVTDGGRVSVLPAVY